MHVQTFYCIVAVDWSMYLFFFFLVSSCVATLRLKSLAVGKRPQQEGGEISSGWDSSF